MISTCLSDRFSIGRQFRVIETAKFVRTLSYALSNNFSKFYISNELNHGLYGATASLCFKWFSYGTSGFKEHQLVRTLGRARPVSALDCDQSGRLGLQLICRVSLRAVADESAIGVSYVWRLGKHRAASLPCLNHGRRPQRSERIHRNNVQKSRL